MKSMRLSKVHCFMMDFNIPDSRHDFYIFSLKVTLHSPFNTANPHDSISSHSFN